ncbi:MAG: PAS domain S-box protein [Kofleriaceae bacterium]
MFDVYDRSGEGLKASAQALEQAGGPLPGGARRHRLELHARLRRARDGEWQPFEQHLQMLGSSYARTGLAIAAWYEIANVWSDEVVARAIEAYAAEPDRLTEMLRAHGELVTRSLSIIAGGYYEVKQQREHEVTARHKRMIEAALDAMIEIDEQGTVTEFNPAAERTFGYPKEAALGRSLAELIIPARMRERHRQGLARVLATGEVRLLGKRAELTAMRADGAELPVELALVAAVRLDGGRSFIGFLRDLTEQRGAEESLALRAHAVEQAQFGIVISDPVTHLITNVNPAYARLVGYAQAELIGTTGAQLFARASSSSLADVRRALGERGYHSYELTLLRKDGAEVPVFASTSTIETRSGALMRVSTVTDISERAELERARETGKQALERSAARLEVLSTTAHEFAASSGNIDALLELVARRLAEIIGEGCAVRLISADGHWLEPSSSFYHRDPAHVSVARQMLGTERQRVGEGMAGRVAATGIALLVPVLDAEQLSTVMAPAFRPMLSRVGVSSALAIPLRSRGRTIGAISLLRSAPGHPYTVDDQRFAQDLADRAGLAIDNAVLVATLEQRVADRTAALETANRELEAFSYTVSHDLRTPLRAIDGFSRMLLLDYQDKLDDRAQHYLRRIRSGTERMSALIDDLLNLARITNVALELGSHDLSAIAAGVATEIRSREPARTTPIHIAPGLSARVDARLFKIVLENLLGNAWKFTARHPAAEIWFGADHQTFWIRDTGAGFDMAYAKKLFRPFQRLHAAESYDGTGVGLATVHRIITHHGGRIWVEAEVDRGAAFFFTLGDLSV